MTEALKPCPFCGAKAHVAGSLFFSDAIVVKCEEGHSNGCIYADRDIAIAAWNRRAALAALPAPPVGAREEEVR